MSSVNVGLVGVGNCASSLVQGLSYYSNSRRKQAGLKHALCAGFAVSDVRFTSAFDVDDSKIGHDLSQAIWAAPNNAARFSSVPRVGVNVSEGIVSEGQAHGAAEYSGASAKATIDDVAERLRSSDTHVVVNFLPAGSQKASELYAEAAIRADCAFVNCIPSVIARSPRWISRFESAGLPLIGDDLRSQFGVARVHQALAEFLSRNGVQLRSAFEIVSSGKVDCVNRKDPERRVRKAENGSSFARTELPPGKLHCDSEYVPALNDRMVTFIRIEGETFGGTPIELELRMSVEDSPGAAGNVLDAVRYMKFALERGICGVIDPVSSLLMKASPRLMSESMALAEIQVMVEP